MKTPLHRLLRVERGEGRLVFVLGLLLFGNSMSIQMSSVVAISGFLNADGLDRFLIVIFLDMVIVLGATAFQSIIIDRYDRVLLLRLVTVGFAIAFAILWLLLFFNGPMGLYYSLIYILAEQQLLFFPLLVWALASDLFSQPQARRLFPVINSLRFIGRILGLLIIGGLALLPRTVGVTTREVLLLDALYYILAYFLITYELRGYKVHRTAVRTHLRETLAEGWNFVKAVPMFRAFTLAILLVSSTDILIEFRFLAIADANLTGVREYEAYFSLYRLCIALICFAISGLGVSRILRRLGLRNVFFVMPVAVIVSALLLLSSPTLVAATLAMGLMQVTRDTIHDSSRMTFYALVPNERRGRVSMFVDSYVMAAGTIFGVLLTVLLIVILGPALRPIALRYYLSFAIFASAGALVAVSGLRHVYDHSLLNWRLRRRKRSTPVLDGVEL